ncbi:hypothetical protein CC80DRAFT_311978 [Byssothecium circinans]|uniref:Uncharacterized protein n=1 Tax=Byssothecium circinans TaxID=147558 RepID=A0A6A5U3Z6_9PLEO|nr:hypothetical protein CC80DRAFT_311978 [Byssothecium circinans]
MVYAISQNNATSKRRQEERRIVERPKRNDRSVRDGLQEWTQDVPGPSADISTDHWAQSRHSREGLIDDMDAVVWSAGTASDGRRCPALAIVFSQSRLSMSDMVPLLESHQMGRFIDRSCCWHHCPTKCKINAAVLSQ